MATRLGNVYTTGNVRMIDRSTDRSVGDSFSTGWSGWRWFRQLPRFVNETSDRRRSNDPVLCLLRQCALFRIFRTRKLWEDWCKSNAQPSHVLPSLYQTSDIYHIVVIGRCAIETKTKSCIRFCSLCKTILRIGTPHRLWRLLRCFKSLHVAEVGKSLSFFTHMRSGVAY